MNKATPKPKEEKEKGRRELARRNAGYETLDKPARKLHLTKKYLRDIELGKPVPFETASRLATFYGVSIHTYL